MRFTLAALIASAVVFGAEFPTGSKLDSLTLSSGPQISFSSAKATAVVFVSTQCPVSNAYNDRMSELYRDYSSKGVQFVFVNANQNESAAEIEAHTKSSGFAFKVHRDDGSALADRLNAQYTPEVFVFDSKGVLAYHGRIDDSRELARVTKKDTRAALDAMIAGQSVAVADTKAFGCTIKRAKKTS